MTSRKHLDEAESNRLSSASVDDAIVGGRQGTVVATGIEIDGKRYQLLCVDDVLPRHRMARASARPRLVYAADEVVHFELVGHSYALVAEGIAPGSAPATDDDSAASHGDVRRLLTNRELQIVQLICMGFLTKQVASRLRISEFTVRSYLKTIYCKLGVRSRGAMVYRYAQAFKHDGIT